MSKKQFFLIIGIFFSLSLIQQSSYAEEQIVFTVPDENLYIQLKNLRSCINYDDSIRQISMTESCRDSIKDLLFQEKNISSIEGIQYFTNANHLDLDHNNISDLSPLSEMTNLTELELESNKINDISPLSKLINLTDLYLANYNGNGNNNITDISILSKMTSLKTLLLEYNCISDITPLPANIEEIDISHNCVADITPIYGIKAYETNRYNINAQNATVYYNNQTTNTPSILRYRANIVDEFDFCDISHEDTCIISLENAQFNNDFSTITIGDITKPAVITIKDDYYRSITTITMLYKTQDDAEEQEPTPPNTIDTSLPNILLAITSSILLIALTSKAFKR